MVLDSLDNAALYEGLHPRFKQAFDFVKSTDFSTLAPGKLTVDGENLFVVVAEIDGQSPADTLVETHTRYIDIQLPLSAPEQMGFVPRGSLHSESVPYHSENDITFFEEKATSFIDVHPGEFVIFFPHEGHQPGLGQGKIRKLIVKILL